MLNAEGLAHIFNDLFGGIVYAGIDTDRHKYPIGSGRVTFNNHKSYMKAVAAAFIEIKSLRFTKKVQVDPYLEDALCSNCLLKQGPYFCRYDFSIIERILIPRFVGIYPASSITAVTVGRSSTRWKS